MQTFLAVHHTFLPYCMGGHTDTDLIQTPRAVIKRRGPGISPSYYERLPRLLSKANERKIERKEIPSCLIPHLLVVFTLQLEILVTTLRTPHYYYGQFAFVPGERKSLNFL